MKSTVEQVYDSAIKLLVPLDLKTTYKVIVQEAMSLLEGELGTIFMMEKGKFQRTYTTNSNLLPITPRAKGFTYKAYKSKKPLILPYTKIVDVHPEIVRTKIKYDLLTPLMNRGRSIGVLSIMSRKKKFGKRDLELLNYFTPLASLAIRKAQLYADLNNALKTRDLFISMAAHELRTPVTTMYVYTQLLKRKSAKGKKFDAEWINNLLYEMARLTKLIDELLQVNQIKTGNLKYEFEETNLDQVLKRSLRTFKASHPNSIVNYKYEYSKPALVVADPNKIEQVIINLLDNSAKHNQWEKPISLLLVTNGKVAKIIVEDYGAGIDKEDQGRIFEEFYKGAGHTKAGMGLGLYLIKKIVDEHKGKIEIKSKTGKGTKVTVSLPIAKYGGK